MKRHTRQQERKAEAKAEPSYQDPHGGVRGNRLEMSIGREVRRAREKLNLTLNELAKASRIGVERVQRLLKLHATPVSHSIRAIFASVLIDRLALWLLSIAALLVAATLALAGHPRGALYTAIGTLAVWSGVHVWLSRQRNLDPATQMHERAGRTLSQQLVNLIGCQRVHTGCNVRVRRPARPGGSSALPAPMAGAAVDPRGSRRFSPARIASAIRSAASG